MLPEKFTERMRNMLGAEYEAFMESFSEEKYQALRMNPQKADSDFVNKKIFHLEQVDWEPNGYRYEAQDQPGKHPYHEAGLYYIQEPSAMAPVTLLSPQPGERILDLCAAPGGKSTQIASAMEGEGHRSHLTVDDTDEITFQHTVDITLDMTVHSDPTGRRQRLRQITL